MLSLNASAKRHAPENKAGAFQSLLLRLENLLKDQDSVKDISSLTEIAKEEASGGSERMQTLRDEMNKISDTVRSVEEMMQEIVKEANQQSMMNEVVDQSNHRRK